MSRRLRDHRLETRTARSKLARRPDPYWRLIAPGLHLGYFKGEQCGKWVVRCRASRSGTGYRKSRLAQADDWHDANGREVLNFEQAQKAAMAWAEHRASHVRVGPYSVSRALDEYLADFKGKSLDKTRGRVESAIRPVLGMIELSRLTPEDILEWRNRYVTASTERLSKLVSDAEALRRSRSTSNRDLTILRAALNAGFHRGLIPSDLPWRRVKPFANVEGVRLRYLSKEECTSIISACDIIFRPMVQAALLTGARYGELCRLLVRDLDVASATLRLWETKSGSSRPVYLSDEGLLFFQALTKGRPLDHSMLPRPDGKAWGTSQQSRFMARACKDAKISAACFHDLRRTYGAHLALQRVEMRVIAEALGHKDERITRRHYAHLAPSYIAETIRNAMNPIAVRPPQPSLVGA